MDQGGVSTVRSVWFQSSAGHQSGEVMYVAARGDPGQRMEDILGLMACLFSTDLHFTVGLLESRDKSPNGFPGMFM